MLIRLARTQLFQIERNTEGLWTSFTDYISNQVQEMTFSRKLNGNTCKKCKKHIDDQLIPISDIFVRFFLTAFLRLPSNNDPSVSFKAFLMIRHKSFSITVKNWYESFAMSPKMKYFLDIWKICRFLNIAKLSKLIYTSFSA